MWTVTMTVPNIMYAVSAVARFCENPGLAHKKAVLEVMQYVLYTKKWGGLVRWAGLWTQL